MRNRHRYAIQQASRRLRGGRRGDSARTHRNLLISTQVPAVLGGGYSPGHGISLLLQDRAPRSEEPERLADPGRPRQDFRLWFGQGRRFEDFDDGHDDARRRPGGHTRFHGAGAAQREHFYGKSRRLQLRHGALGDLRPLLSMDRTQGPADHVSSDHQVGQARDSEFHARRRARADAALVGSRAERAAQLRGYCTAAQGNDAEAALLDVRDPPLELSKGCGRPAARVHEIHVCSRPLEFPEHELARRRRR